MLPECEIIVSKRKGTYAQICGPTDGPLVQICQSNAGKEDPWQACATCRLSGLDRRSPDGGEVALSTIRFFIPRSLYPVWNMAAGIYSARCRSAGKEPGLIGFLDALVDHFLEVWDTPEGRSFHDQVLARDGYECQWPGCGCRRNLEAHHIRFRSQGGSDKSENGLALCRPHHKACVHPGFMKITGEAPDTITLVKKYAEPDGTPVVFHNGERVLDEGKRQPGDGDRQLDDSGEQPDGGEQGSHDDEKGICHEEKEAA